MRAHVAGVLLLFGGIIPLWVGCTGERAPQAPQAPEAPPSCPPPFLTNEKRLPRLATCVRDADCQVGFCDRGVCPFFRGYANYGEACEVPYHSSETPHRPGESEHPCGAYLCIDRRCRSCQSDRECGERSTCTHRRGWPGRSCTTDLSEDPDVLVPSKVVPPQVVSPQVCPKVEINRPDLPEEQRLTFGAACFQDSDCRSGLCDRGTCGDLYVKGNYGRECVPGPSPPPDKPKMGRHPPPLGENLCTGYLCIDGRCRSCTSDAECQWEGSAGPKCLHYQGWYGKRCGTPGVANLAPVTEIPQSTAPSPPPIVSLPQSP